MKLLKLLAAVFFISVICAQGIDTIQIDQSEFIKIDSIKIIGNDVTEDFVIRRELTFSEGDEINRDIIEYNKERVFSLGLFNKVEIFPTKTDDVVYANIVVKETWYIFPLPYFESKGADFKRMRIGLYLLYRNFRGRNETISSKIGFGYDPFYSLMFESPLLFEGSDLQFSAGIVNMKVSNKSDYIKTLLMERGESDFNYRSVTSFVNVGKRIDKFNRFFLNLSYSYVDMPLHLPNLTASGDRIDRILSSGLLYELDSRDLIQNPTNGVYFTSSFIHSGFGMKGIAINKFDLDLRHYYRLNSRFYAKYRFYARNIYGDNIPRYTYSYLGINEFIRGHKNDQREGKNMLLGSIELNYQIIKEWNISFKLPLLPRKLTSYRIGFVAKLFADAGTVYNKYKTLNFNGFDAGYGGGIMLLVLPHKAFRCEYAINKYGKGEFIFGAGFSF